MRRFVRTDPSDLRHTLSGRRSEEHTSELQSRLHLVCRLLLEKKKKHKCSHHILCYYIIVHAEMPIIKPFTDSTRNTATCTPYHIRATSSVTSMSLPIIPIMSA